MSSTSNGVTSVERVIDGKFPLLQELGGTEWSCAYLTQLDDGGAQKAAIKIFKFESVDTPTTIARWEVAETVSHPHLMPLFCSGRCEFDGEDLLYVVTEHADETLSQILPDRPLSPEEARAMLGPVLDALSCLHQRGLTHGHLRPTNIMVIEDKVKLSPDFGWCSRIRNIYDPPEAGAGSATPAADIWSLGILLVEALTQQLPTWDRSQGGEPEIPANLPEPFLTICRQCLRTDPELRCTLPGIQSLLNPLDPAELAARPAEPAVQPAQPIAHPAEAIAAEAIAVEAMIDRAAHPSYRFRAVIFAGALLFLLLMIAAFSFGWNLTPTSPASAAQSAATVPTAATLPPAAIVPAASSRPTAQPARAPASIAPSSRGDVVQGSASYQAMPDIPQKIADTIRGHFKVRLRVEVDPAGRVSQALIESPGPSPYFANQALHAAQSWKFTPARVDGRAVPSTWLLQFQFGQSQSVVTPSEETP
jgi:TonB family protein